MNAAVGAETAITTRNTALRKLLPAVPLVMLQLCAPVRAVAGGAPRSRSAHSSTTTVTSSPATGKKMHLGARAWWRKRWVLPTAGAVAFLAAMRILLVSVTERTREIGLRMALGARRAHVMLQFLAEAVFLSAAGGTAGIVLGIGTSELVAVIAGWPIEQSLTAVLGGFLFSAIVGVFFGYYPARKAAALNPIEALRYE